MPRKTFRTADPETRRESSSENGFRAVRELETKVRPERHTKKSPDDTAAKPQKTSLIDKLKAHAEQPQPEAWTPRNLSTPDSSKRADRHMGDYVAGLHERNRMIGDEFRRPRKGKGSLIALVMLGVIFMILGSIVFGGWFLLVRSPGQAIETGKEVTVVIPEGSSVSAIADILVQHGIVDNANMFKLMVRMRAGGTLFHAGSYTLVTGSGYDAAITALSAPPAPVEVVTLTIIEGLRIDAIAQAVSDQMGLSAAEFEARAHSGAPDYAETYPYLAGIYNGSLEGFLFPDTYEFTDEATIDDVIARMLARFDDVWQSLEVPKERLEMFSVPELVTIASLTEREASWDKERPLVASVIENRLEIDMMLQFCSTVQFLLPPERMTVLPLSLEDIQIESPYNTYRNAGLPPGPICNPSKASLEAAARPADTDYLYFVLTSKTGEQTFSRTWEEHDAASALAAEVFGY